jgi:thiol-disulfide isomerase/thioredoxin
MRKFWKWTLSVVGGVVGVLALLVFAMWLSADVRYAVLYSVMERVDLNPPIPADQLARQIRALKRANLIDGNGRPFDWNERPRAIVWFNEWANWCVPCRMEFPAMKALEDRLGRDKLRIVLFSQPQYWDGDRRLAKQLGLDFELVTVKDASESDLAAINLSRHARSFLLPEHSFFRADGRGIEAMHTVRDWDSAAWQTTIAHWYETR